MDKLYHYTSIETLYNMLDKSIIVDEETNTKYLKMWATHIEYLNDEMERKLFTDMLTRKVEKYAIEIGHVLDDEQRKVINMLCRVDSYIISLSELNDDLSMWRGYGGNGVGVNIEFDFYNIPPFYATSKHNTFKTEKVFRAIKCDYLEPESCYIDKLLIKKIYKHCLEDNKNVFDGAIIMKEIQDLSTKSKHIAYVSEKEWRFVCTPNSRPKHLFSNGIIKPYIEYPIPINAITAVTIGPCIKDEYSIVSLERFIRKKLSSNIRIEYSKIPYRRY